MPAQVRRRDGGGAGLRLPGQNQNNKTKKEKEQQPNISNEHKKKKIKRNTHENTIDSAFQGKKKAFQAKIETK